jgi:hypothetical protein
MICEVASSPRLNHSSTGRVVIGLVNDVMRNLSSGLWASVVLLFIAAMLGALQRDREAA